MGKLKDYYNELPELNAPKSDFIREIASLTGKAEQTVRLWLWGKTKPSEKEDLEVLSKLTGIEVNQLFDENEK